MGNSELISSVSYTVGTEFQLVQRNSIDVIEQAYALPFWAQDYTQLSKGVFAGSIYSIHRGGIQIFTEKMNRAVDQLAKAPKDCYVIGLPTIVEGDAVWGHLPVRQNSLITLDKNAELYFRTSSTSEIIAAVIPASRLEEFARKIDWVDFDEAMSCIKPVETLHSEIAGRLLRTLWYALQTASINPATINASDKWTDFEEELLSACMHALIHASKNIHPRFDHRIPRYIVNRVREITLINDGIPLSIDELCELLHIRPRTLNQAFTRALGTTPLTYMRNLKLQQIRIELVSQPHEVSSIAAVASKWGFVHLSLFSRYYRELFGECPIETLQRVKAGV
jgi:AraC family ethanolamine operon transcriptional activator